MLMNIEKLETKKKMCDLFIDAYKAIVASRENEFDAIRSAEDDSLKKAAKEFLGNYDEYKKNEAQIRKYYRQLSYQKFLEVADDNLFTSRILHKIKSEILQKNNYKNFYEIGLRTRPGYNIDEKMFYADYLVSTMKAPELEAMIEFEKQNRKWGK